MTLLISVFAAIIATVVWYAVKERKKYKLAMPCFMFWGASIMWFVDAIFELADLKEAYFMPALEDMINDTFLGLSVVALGLIVWVVTLVVSDPNGVFKKQAL